MTSNMLWLFGALDLLLAFAMWTDIGWRKVPITAALAVALFTLAVRAEDGWGGLEYGAASGLLGLGLAAGFGALWARRGKLGWGDVFLMGACGAVFGFPAAVVLLAFTSVAGLALGIYWVAARPGAHFVGFKRGYPVEGVNYAPFAIAVTAGALATEAWVWWS